MTSEYITKALETPDLKPLDFFPSEVRVPQGSMLGSVIWSRNVINFIQIILNRLTQITFL